jgi:hypothetical protein
MPAVLAALRAQLARPEQMRPLSATKKKTALRKSRRNNPNPKGVVQGMVGQRKEEDAKNQR